MGESRMTPKKARLLTLEELKAIQDSFPDDEWVWVTKDQTIRVSFHDILATARAALKVVEAVKETDRIKLDPFQPGRLKHVLWSTDLDDALKPFQQTVDKVKIKRGRIFNHRNGQKELEEFNKGMAGDERKPTADEEYCLSGDCEHCRKARNKGGAGGE